jgi:tripartite ATP-independent transporter DctM subunit
MAVSNLTAGADSFTLLAVPGFILAGNIMNATQLTDKIFNFASKLVGHITGGLAHANVLASIIFAGMSGAAIADAGGLGAIELKAMKDAGYDEDFSLAVTGASSIVGPIIPPSIPAVVFGVAGSVSIGRLFAAGFIPGLIMGLSMMAAIYIICKKKGMKRSKRATLKEIGISVKEGFFALLTPIIIIGGIVGGYFSATEASMIAVAYALILGFAYRTVKLKDLPGIFIEAAETTTSVMFIVCSATIFGWIIAFEQFPQMVASFFLANISSKIMLLLIVNLMLFLIGMFMDSTPAIIILTPVLLPVVQAYGVSPVHFGIIMILNLMIGLCTPPVGMVLYVLSKVSKVPFERIAKAIMPFIIISFILLLIFTFVPAIVTWLPEIMYGSI